jgi:hypothetical protein
MDGLRTARVLVLDNEIEEAKPFMEALAKSGVGSIYYSGDLDTLPSVDAKLTGIRLAAIDLDLEVGGEAPNVISVLIRVLNRIIRKDNGPYLAIAWTGTNEDYFDEFMEQQSKIDCQPIRVIRMEKARYSAKDTIDEFFHEVSRAVEESHPLGLLSFWEQTIHDSSRGVMEILPDSANWIAESSKTLRLLLDASAARGESQEANFVALLTSLNAVQLDNIETAALTQMDDTTDALLSPLNDVHLPEPDDDGHDEYNDIKATLNHRLLCSAPLPAIAPGNIYSCENISSSQTRLFPTVGELAFDTANGDCQDNHRKLRAANCVPIAMEVSPLCDYQQGGKGFPRFICGLAVPFDQISLLKQRALFLRKTQPIAFDTPPLQGKMVLVWNSHYMVSVPRKLLVEATALVRLRQAPLIDVQAWLGSQGNRPGYLSIHMFDD